MSGASVASAGGETSSPSRWFAPRDNRDTPSAFRSPCGSATRVVLYCAGDMEDRSPFTDRVLSRLRRAGLAPLAAAFLEAASPLALVAAQLGYLIEPLLGRSEVGELSRLLEDDAEMSDLVRRLRAEES